MDTKQIKEKKAGKNLEVSEEVRIFAADNEPKTIRL
jgi:hypothetical protein